MVVDIILKFSFSMNLKRYQFIRLNRSNSDQSGFAMPLALGLGLVMMIVSASTIARSQSDRTTTNFQKEANRALSISEAGAIRVQSFLDRYKLLANKDLDRWVDTLNTLPESQRNCNALDIVAAKQQSQLFEDRNWISLDNNNPNKGKYRIINYQYQAGVGTLTVAGSIDAYNTSENSSTSILKLVIPINSETAKVPPPALWAATFQTNPNQQINGQIRAVICPQPTSEDPDGIIGIDRTNLTQLEGKASGKIIADPFISIPIPKDAPNIAARIPAITTSIQFPLNVSDLPDLNGEYNYLVDIDNDTSKYSIKLQDGDQIKINIAAKHKINLYLKGNIDLAASQTISVNSSQNNLRIYGGNNTTKFSIKNNASIRAFIHTPFAVAQNIESTTTSSGGNITGGIWVKSWDSATNQGKIPIIQSGTWKDFGIDVEAQPPQLNPISHWRRIEGN